MVASIRLGRVRGSSFPAAPGALGGSYCHLSGEPHGRVSCSGVMVAEVGNRCPTAAGSSPRPSLESWPSRHLGSASSTTDFSPATTSSLVATTHHPAAAKATTTWETVSGASGHQVVL